METIKGTTQEHLATFLNPSIMRFKFWPYLVNHSFSPPFFSPSFTSCLALSCTSAPPSVPTNAKPTPPNRFFLPARSQWMAALSLASPPLYFYMHIFVTVSLCSANVYLFLNTPALSGCVSSTVFLRHLGSCNFPFWLWLILRKVAYITWLQNPEAGSSCVDPFWTQPAQLN